uniref:Uncharacterized protein n=1 Tax=Solanum lycopersicum TaxID=4081 RepID=A0A3Q7HWV7_SOLLC
MKNLVQFYLPEHVRVVGDWRLKVVVMAKDGYKEGLQQFQGLVGGQSRLTGRALRLLLLVHEKEQNEEIEELTVGM